VYVNSLLDFYLPVVVTHIKFYDNYKICVYGGSAHNVDGDKYSIVDEDSLFSYYPTYSYTEVREYTVGGNSHYNLIYNYDSSEKTLLFDGILTYLGYKLVGNNPWLEGLPCFSLFFTIKPMSVTFTRYIFRVKFIVDVYFIENKLYVKVACDNGDLEAVTDFVFAVGFKYNVAVVFSRYKGLYVYVDGGLAATTEVQVDIGNTKAAIEGYVSVGSFLANKYSPYKFYGYLYNLGVVESYLPETSIVDLFNNNIVDVYDVLDRCISVDVVGVIDIFVNSNDVVVVGYNTIYVHSVDTFVVKNTYDISGFVYNAESIDGSVNINVTSSSPLISIKSKTKGVVRLSGKYDDYIFTSNGKICYYYYYNNYTYVKTNGSTTYGYLLKDRIGDYSDLGSVYLGNYYLDTLNRECKVVGEYFLSNNTIVGVESMGSYRNSGDTIMSDCDGSMGFSVAYSSYPASYVNVDIPDSYSDFDIYFNIRFYGESRTTFNMLGLCLSMEVDSGSYDYDLSVDRFEDIRFPKEILVRQVVKSVGASLPKPTDPIQLYLTDADMLGYEKINYYISVGNIVSILRARKKASFASNNSDSTNFIYDFSGNNGNGIEYFIDDDLGQCGRFIGKSYVYNSYFNDTPVWDIEISIIVKLSYTTFVNPIVSKTDGVNTSYQVAVDGTELVIMYSINNVISKLNTGITIPVDEWLFLGLFITDTNITVLVNSSKYKVSLYTNLQYINSGIYVGYGVDLGGKSIYFTGSMSQFIIRHGGSFNSILHDKDTFFGSFGSFGSYDNLADILLDYIDMDNRLLKFNSTYVYDPNTHRYMSLGGFKIIGYDVNSSVRPIADEPDVYNYTYIYDMDAGTLDRSTSSSSISVVSPKNDVYVYYNDSLTVHSDFNNFEYVNYVYSCKNTIIVCSIVGIAINNVDTEPKRLYVMDGVTKCVVVDDVLYYVSAKKLYQIPLKDIVSKSDYSSISKVNEVASNVVDIDNVNGNVIVLGSEGVVSCNSSYISLVLTESYDKMVIIDHSLLYLVRGDYVYKYNFINSVWYYECIFSGYNILNITKYNDCVVITVPTAFYVYDPSSGLQHNVIGVEGILEDVYDFYGVLFCVFISDISVVVVGKNNNIKVIEYFLSDCSKGRELLNLPMIEASITETMLHNVNNTNTGNG
jgi:hypothetical protein